MSRMRKGMDLRGARRGCTGALLPPPQSPRLRASSGGSVRQVRGRPSLLPTSCSASCPGAWEVTGPGHARLARTRSPLAARTCRPCHHRLEARPVVHRHFLYILRARPGAARLRPGFRCCTAPPDEPMRTAKRDFVQCTLVSSALFRAGGAQEGTVCGAPAGSTDSVEGDCPISSGAIPWTPPPIRRAGR